MRTESRTGAVREREQPSCTHRRGVRDSCSEGGEQQPALRCSSAAAMQTPIASEIEVAFMRVLSSFWRMHTMSCKCDDTVQCIVSFIAHVYVHMCKVYRECFKKLKHDHDLSFSIPPSRYVTTWCYVVELCHWHWQESYAPPPPRARPPRVTRAERAPAPHGRVSWHGPAPHARGAA